MNREFFAPTFDPVKAAIFFFFLRLLNGVICSRSWGFPPSFLKKFAIKNLGAKWVPLALHPGTLLDHTFFFFLCPVEPVASPILSWTGDFRFFSSVFLKEIPSG